MLIMSVTSDDNLDWFLKYIEALPSNARLDPSDQNIMLTVNSNINTISVENFNKCISELNRCPQDDQDRQQDDQENLQDHHRCDQNHQQGDHDDQQDHQQENQDHQLSNQDHQLDDQDHHQGDQNQQDDQDYQQDNQENLPGNQDYHQGDQNHQQGNQDHQQDDHDYQMQDDQNYRQDNQDHQQDNQDHHRNDQDHQQDDEDHQQNDQNQQQDDHQQKKILKVLLKQIKRDPKSSSMEPFNSWQADNSTSEQGVHHYKCLDTTELSITVEIPSSLYTLLAKAMQRAETVQSSTHITTHKIKVRVIIKTEKVSTAAAVDTQDPITKINAFEELSLSSNDVNVDTDLDHVIDEAITDVNALLALIIVLKCYPDKWKDLFWDAWLAVAVQLYLQGKYDNDDEVFPSLWMDSQGIFFAESQVAPKIVRCLLLGQDPVSKNLPIHDLRKATGIAFHNIGNANSSISNMGKYYNLDCKDDEPKEHCRNGIFIVNMIRCIFENGKSMSGNKFKEAWTAYTLKLANYFNKSEQVSKIIVFCKSLTYKPCLATKYLPKVVSKEKFMEVPHPSRMYQYQNFDAETKKDVKGVAEYLKSLVIVENSHS